MVNGQIYTWTYMAGPGFAVPIPIDLVYLAEFEHIEGETLTEDYQLIADFEITGEIYVDPNDEEDYLYLLVTTDWLDEAYVLFTPNRNEFWLQHNEVEAESE